ncbi:dihydrodipicolinate synthase family protein, partial [Salmonella enterica]
MAKALKCVMAALLTPFDNQKQLYSESLRRLVRFNIGPFSKALYVGGST